jgi:hypothetical protein
VCVCRGRGGRKINRYNNYEETVQRVQRSTELKNLLLEKNLAELEKTLHVRAPEGDRLFGGYSTSLRVFLHGSSSSFAAGRRDGAGGRTNIIIIIIIVISSSPPPPPSLTSTHHHS